MAKNPAITNVVMPGQFTSSVVQVNGVSFNINNLKVLDGLRDIMLVGKNLVDVGFELSVTIAFIVFHIRPDGGHYPQEGLRRHNIDDRKQNM